MYVDDLGASVRVYTVPVAELGSWHAHPPEDSYQVVGLRAAQGDLWLPGDWPGSRTTTHELPFSKEAERGFADYFREALNGDDAGNCHTLGAVFDRRYDIRVWVDGARYAKGIVAAGKLATDVAVGQHAVYGMIADLAHEGSEEPWATHSIIGAGVFYLQRDSVGGPICLVPRAISDASFKANGYSLYVA